MLVIFQTLKWENNNLCLVFGNNAMNELASHVGDVSILAWPKIASGVTSALVTRG